MSSEVQFLPNSDAAGPKSALNFSASMVVLRPDQQKLVLALVRHSLTLEITFLEHVCLQKSKYSSYN
jgi:hypothetical protein